ncbi:MAG: hypothetical protein CFH01_01412 [Alphaproteobacteria bacterium MarineAlpha2_Bin1]|nr:MAG: hypothetical protein CFH01_01412 [Alphaproteobacteria bacterium MarineAlpha2_Bin1]|tara:strand:+ start:279 stop:686 length:408 start_codon:yes stop_codon:yes gene_type:complete
MSQFINFQNLKLKKTKNQYLALPEKIMYTSSPDVFSPNFICKVEDLKNSFEGVIDKQPRISKKFYDSERNKFKCIQKTKFFKFPDLIDVEFIKIKDNISSIAIYSRSVYGYYDFNVNRNRVKLWIEIICKTLPTD